MNLRNGQIFELNKKLAKFLAAKFLVRQCKLVSYLIQGSHCNRQFDKARISFYSPSQQKRRPFILLGTGTKKQDPHHVYLSNEVYRNSVTRFFLVCVHTISNERMLTS